MVIVSLTQALGAGLASNESTISTVAGGGVGDGLSASRALLHPASSLTDAADNIYIASNNRIRRIDSQTGIITTFAGTGVPGFSGDGGPAIDARLRAPIGLAFNRDQTYLYFSDRNNGRIRVIEMATGTINTVAGDGASGFDGDEGPALAASFRSVADVAVGHDGSIYIADETDNRVRKVASSGIVSTVAGTGEFGYSKDGGAATSTTLSRPTGVEIGPDGLLYIADRQSARIRKVTSEGKIITVAGLQRGYVENSLFDLQHMSPLDYGVPATMAALIWPRDLAFAADGSFVIADFLTVHKVDEFGLMSTVAGHSHRRGYGGDGDLAVLATFENILDVSIESDGEILISDGDNLRLRKVDRSGKVFTASGNGTFGHCCDGAAATTASMGTVMGIARNAAGEIFVSDAQNHRVRKIGLDGIISTYAGSGAAGFSGDGGPATSAQLNNPHSLVLAADGSLYIADSFNHRVRRVSQDGLISTVAGTGQRGVGGDGVPPKSSHLSVPLGLAITSSGELLLSDQTNRVRKIAGGVITTIAGTGQMGVSGDGGSALAATLNAPGALHVGQGGVIFIADTGNHRVRKIDSNGVIATVASASFPWGLTTDSIGNLFISDSWSNRVLRIDLNGISSVIAGTGTSGFSGDGGAAHLAELRIPTGLTSHGGQLWIADRDNGRVRVVTGL